MANEEEKYISILIDSRRFVRIESGTEIPVNVYELKEGDRYDDIVRDACDGEEGPDTYEWDCGVAP